MTTPSQLALVSLTRGSRQNGFNTSYTFLFTQTQAITDATGVVLIEFPSEVILPVAPVCSSGPTILSCSLY